jgi:hypothetical protein
VVGVMMMMMEGVELGPFWMIRYDATSPWQRWNQSAA